MENIPFNIILPSIPSYETKILYVFDIFHMRAIFPANLILIGYKLILC
jgi:hypothetical protein